MINLAILISGRGSNMTALADAIKAYNIPAKITVVISNRCCAGINLAQDRGLPTRIIKRKSYNTQAEHEAAIAATIHYHRSKYVFLAGYMAVLSGEFVNQFVGQIINIHPSLLPALKGLNTHQRAVEGNATMHGVSIHLVTAALDEGPMIAQAGLPLLAGDTADSLAERVLNLEHQLYPFVLLGLAKKFLSLSPEGARWRAPSSALADAPAPMQDALTQCLIWPAPTSNR
jgi:phosphoribosylglycinamide formyltransferase-1